MKLRVEGNVQNTTYRSDGTNWEYLVSFFNVGIITFS